MSDLFVDTKSVWRGISIMHFRNKAKWSVKFMPKRIWLHAWTPIWHENNGPYISCGLWIFAVYRGY